MSDKRDKKAPEQEAQYPVLTNQPDTLLMNPQRRVRMGVVMLAVAIILGSGVAAYSSTSVAGAKTDKHTDELMAELNKRTADRRRGEAVTAAILEQNRRTLCEVLPAVQPTSAPHQAKLSQLVKAYRCGTAQDPLVPQGWSPPPSWPPLPPGTGGFTAVPTVAPTLPGGR